MERLDESEKSWVGGGGVEGKAEKETRGGKRGEPRGVFIVFSRPRRISALNLTAQTE